MGGGVVVAATSQGYRMGKQAKTRHRAVTVASDPHPIPQAKRPRRPKAPPRKTVLNTDVLTGDYLDPAHVHFFKRMPDVDESRPEPARQPIPYTLHSARETAVGKDWSPAFSRYMAPVLPRLIAEERRMWVCWWDVEYVVGRLVKYLGKETVSATILVLRDDWSVRQVAHHVSRSDAWVCRQITITLAWAETYFTHKANRQRPHVNERPN